MSPTPPCPTDSETVHKRHNEDHKKAQENNFLCFFGFILCLLCTVSPIGWAKPPLLTGGYLTMYVMVVYHAGVLLLKRLRTHRTPLRKRKGPPHLLGK